MRIEWMRGCATALVTPFGPDGAVDLDRVAMLAERQIAAGVPILLANGTTGETATLDEREQSVLLRTVVRTAHGRARVIAGVGSYATAVTIERARAAVRDGADALLVVTPYYNKPSAAGLVAHFEAVAAAVPDTPIVLYNVPGRTACNLDAETTLRIARAVPNVVAIKEASGSIEQISAVLRGRPAGFRVFSGDDAMTLPLIALGADGVMSVVSNEAPAEMSALADAALRGDITRARQLHFDLLPLIEANFAEGSPAGVKAAMAELGLLEDRLRLPLVSVGDRTRARLRAALTQLHVEAPKESHVATS